VNTTQLVKYIVMGCMHCH